MNELDRRRSQVGQTGTATIDCNAGFPADTVIPYHGDTE